MSKAFDTVNIHKLIDKLIHTNVLNNISKFIANYIKGRKAFWDTTSTQHKEAFFHPYSSTYKHQTYLLLPNNLILNLDKTTCILFTLDPAEHEIQCVPMLEYVSTIWSLIASATNFTKLQNIALTHCSWLHFVTNIQRLHDKTNILQLHIHIILHASQI